LIDFPALEGNQDLKKAIKVLNNAYIVMKVETKLECKT
jgi:hypothetical protein